MKTVKVDEKEYLEQEDGTLVPITREAIQVPVTFDREQVFALVGLFELIFDDDGFDPIWWNTESCAYFRLNSESLMLRLLHKTIINQVGVIMDKLHLDEELFIPSYTYSSSVAGTLKGIITEQLGVQK